MALQNLRLFALRSSSAFAESVASRVGVDLSAHEERNFEDGEHKVRPLVNVRGADVFVIESLYGEPERSVNDKLIRLLFFIGCLKDASAARVTAVVPHLAYARKDRKTQPRDPVTTRYLAALFEAVGVDRIVVLDVHNLQAYQNSFRCRTEHLEARGLFVRHFAARLRDEEVVVVSPDTGGAKRAERFRASLGRVLNKAPASAFVEKYRAKGVVSGEAVVGDVAGKVAIICDDLISTGGTVLRAAKACLALGATSVHAAATHAVFGTGAMDVIADPALRQVVVTNSIPPARLDSVKAAGKVSVLDAAPLVADAIVRIHRNGSIAELLED